MPSTGIRPKRLGRYVLHDEIAAGGMGTVHLARLEGAQGFSRIVAIKRLHPAMSKQRDVVQMFLDEARLAAAVRHPNVVPTFDTIESEDDVFIVMEYVHGESLARLIRTANENGEHISPPIVSAIASGLLYGLHAAHDATDAKGQPLLIVHRDVSPANVLVGTDGVARVADFGVAKAAGRLHTTGDGSVKGKIPYMSPEQLSGRPVDRRSDIWAAGAVLWEMLTGRRLFDGGNEGAVVTSVLYGEIRPPSLYAPNVTALDAVTMRALAREPSDRYGDARAMCVALLDACSPAAPHQVAEWVVASSSDRLDARARRIAELETFIDTPTAPDPEPAAPPRRMRRALITAAATLAIVGGAVVFVAQRRPPDPAPEAATTTITAPAVPTAVATEPVSAATSSSPVSAVPSSKPPPRHAAPKHMQPAPRAASTHDCDPPYIRDAEGHKIWKRECFANK